MKCPICHNEVIPNKYAWNKKYCSPRCLRKSRAEYDKQYMRRVRAMHKKDINLIGLHKVGTRAFMNLNTKKVNNELRITAAIELKRSISWLATHKIKKKQ